MRYIPPTESTNRTACWDVRRDPVPGTQVGVTVQLDDPWPIALAGRVELGFDTEDAHRLAVALHSAQARLARHVLEQALEGIEVTDADA